MIRSRREKPPLSARGSFRRAFWVVVIGLGSMVLVDRATRSERPTRPPEPARLDRMSADTLAKHLALTGAVEAALAADEDVARHSPASQAEPLVAPRGVVAVRGVACDGPRNSPEKAKEAAAEVAAALLSDQLARLDSPVYQTLTAGDVLGRYLKKADVQPVSGEDRDALDRASNMQAEWSTATVSAEVTPDQVRKLRAAGRTLAGIKVAAALAALVGALLAFLALDSLTKGYLSWGLGLGLGGAVIGVVGGLFWLV